MVDIYAGGPSGVVVALTSDATPILRDFLGNRVPTCLAAIPSGGALRRRDSSPG